MLSSMVALETVWILGVFFGVIAFSPPFFHYVRSSKVSNLIARPEVSGFYPEITVLLPIRNESEVIERKILEILDSSYPNSKISLLVADSASDDNSVELAENLLSNVENTLDKWKILKIEELGKSIAVNRSLDEVHTDFFVMMDADASTDRDSIQKIVSWFHNQNIGAVCGTSSLRNKYDQIYRKNFNFLRIAESNMDSTPIFEGSICGFRKSALGGRGVDHRINADDSQLAILVRRNGLRAIMDPDIVFNEFNPQKQPISRKIRRAQGLSRTFWKNRDLLFTNSKDYRSIFRSQFFFHLFFPWLAISSLLLIATPSIITNFFDTNISFNFFDLSLIILLLSLMSRTIRELWLGVFCLLSSHILVLAGRRLNVWNPNRSGSQE